MTDAEVALELMKLVLKHEVKVANERDKRKFLLDLYREALAAVRESPEA